MLISIATELSCELILLEAIPVLLAEYNKYSAAAADTSAANTALILLQQLVGVLASFHKVTSSLQQSKPHIHCIY